MRDDPHPSEVIRESDIEFILKRFGDEVAKSTIRHKIAVDTSNASVDESIAEFSKLMEPHFTEIDRIRILRHSRSDTGR